jgi:hypothetical protein
MSRVFSEHSSPFVIANWPSMQLLLDYDMASWHLFHDYDGTRRIPV